MSSNSSNNWIPVTGSAIGALAGGVSGAIIGGIIGAIIKEIFCPRCGSLMKDLGTYFKCGRCGHVIRRR